jgi:DNA-binding CsgD family transcriptional regulator
MDGHLWNRFRASRHAVLVADGDRSHVDGNEAALELLGLSREQLRQRRIDELAAGELREVLARGERHVSIFLAPPGESVWPGGDALTAREREVVCRIAEGDTTHEIAARLFISHTTVDTHVRKAMARLGAKNRAHLIALAFQAGEI